ncbi:gamma-glutamylcyclotransferase family protein [Pseudomonas sp. SM4]|uniref:gamma-glutamylcyclotransferase family protein n=1 Tax=Pseudomonas sp. SM4 TaxID=3424177 RepID=UPI003F7A6E51
MERLFVYGTLGPGRPNEHVMQNIGGTWQPASLRGRLTQAGWGAEMGFPGLVIADDGDVIEGFVFSSQNFPAHWADLDAFEGAEYQRVVTAVTLADGTLIEANVYALR